MRREQHSGLFKEHREKYTKLGEQIINLSEIEIKRIRAGDSCLEYRQEREILCGFPSSEHYRKMGEVHTQKGIEISREEVVEIEKIINGHSLSWCKMFNTGDDHGHRERVAK